MVSIYIYIQCMWWVLILESYIFIYMYIYTYIRAYSQIVIQRIEIPGMCCIIYVWRVTVRRYQGKLDVKAQCTCFQKRGDLTFPDPWSIFERKDFGVVPTIWSFQSYTTIIYTHKISSVSNAVACAPDAVCSRHLLLFLGSFELNACENPPGTTDN